MSGQWQPIETAPTDGTEIIVREADGGTFLVAWSDVSIDHTRDGSDSGWFRRAGGDWDLFDSFAAQEVTPVRWLPIPDDDQ